MNVLAAVPLFPQRRIRQILWGLDLHFAEHRVAALARLGERPFDLVLVSLYLDEKPFDTLEQIVRRAGQAPVLLVRTVEGRYATRAFASIEPAALSLGARGYVDFYALGQDAVIRERILALAGLAARALAERRCHERMPVRARVVVVDEAGESLLGDTRDLSLGGAFVLGPSARVGSRVTLHMQVPETLEPFAMAGTVRRVDGGASSPGIGVELDPLPGSTARVVARLCARASLPPPLRRSPVLAAG